MKSFALRPALHIPSLCLARQFVRNGMVIGLFVLGASSLSAQESQNRQPGDVFKECETCPEMVVVPPGEFLMGWEGGEEARYEGPVHQVTIEDAFAVGRFEVTNAQFAEFIDATDHETRDACITWGEDGSKERAGVTWRDPGYGRPSLPNEPVACVTWTDARAFVAWLAESTGQPYRLLSEAEWEYAARAGRPHTLFTWGETGDDACRYANLYDQSATATNLFRPWDPADCDDGSVELAEIGMLAPNPFGLHDMIGNVWEWVEDCYVMNYFEKPNDGLAQTTYGCDRHGVRGGSWSTMLSRQRPTFRGRDLEDYTTRIFGFRVARDLM